MSPKQRAVAVVLRCFGCLDLLAFTVVVMPRRCMEWACAASGAGELPPGAVVGYLTRSSSLLYALHGALILFLSLDVVRYWRLIRFLALAALVHGVVIFGIDHVEGMPMVWRWTEGPAFAATGAVVLLCQWRAERRDPRG
jgi:hypothetical protein